MDRLTRALAVAFILAVALPCPATADNGVTWKAGPAITAQNTTYAGVQISDTQQFLLRRNTPDGAGLTIDLLQSADFSNTYASNFSAATGLSGSLPTAISALYIPAAGRAVLGGVGDTAARSLVRGSAYSWSFPTITGGPTGTTTAHSLAQQGGTTLVLLQGGTGTICRSTDNAATFTCQTPSGFGSVTALTTSASTGTWQGIASPSLNLWLVLNSTNVIWRSTDDGQTWTNVTTLTANSTVNAILCVTGTICYALASSSAQTALEIYRSTNAGLTWSRVLNLARGDRVTNLINVGQGVAIALGDPTTAAGTPWAYRTADFGATWEPLASPELTAPIATSALVGYTGLFVQSIGGVAGVSVFCTAGAASCGAQVIRSTIAGNPGPETANQGAPASQGNRWPVFLSDGTAAQGTLANPFYVRPSDGSVPLGTVQNPLRVGAVDQGAAAAPLSAWPVKLTDGTTTQAVALPFKAATGADAAAVIALSPNSPLPPPSAPLPIAAGQAQATFNSTATGATNAAVTATIPGLSGHRPRLYGVSAYCSAGSATITVSDAGTNIFTTPSGFVATTLTSIAWTPAALTGAVGHAIIITLGTCGAGNTGTLTVQADRAP